ncbi:hypothetical protein Tco_1502526 [Tanacetum coccineum]
MNNTREPQIGDEFLKILRDNAFNGMDGGDVIDHITRIIEITEWIKIPDINKSLLRVHVFSKSLSNDAEKWWNDEIEGATIRTIGDLDNEPRDENSIITYSEWFYKPHLDTQGGNEICKIINRDGSPILGPARYDIFDQDKLCKTKEFSVVRYSMGIDKEFVAVEPIKRTLGSMSCIYHEIFNRKDHGWKVTRTK